MPSPARIPVLRSPTGHPLLREQATYC